MDGNSASLPAQSGTAGLVKPGRTLISEWYLQEQKELHATGVYGVASIKYAPLVTEIINRLGVDHILDYGCGENIHLHKQIKPHKRLTYQAYDPAVDDFAEEPVPAQMVACIDVLEHIEPEYLESVLDDLERLTEVCLFCTVHTGPAKKLLSDGRNAHLTQEPMSWWLPKLWDRFVLQTVQVTAENEFHVIAYAKPRLIESIEGEKLA